MVPTAPKPVRSTTLLTLILLCFVVLLTMMPCASTDAKKVKKLRPNILEFYMFIVPQNDSFLNNLLAHYTAVTSGHASTTQAFAFGTIHTFDNPISKTMSLANSSDILGRVQGWYTNCGQDELTLCLSQTTTYVDEHFNGTFSLIGRGVANTPIKFESIVGGTGDFAYCLGVSARTRVSNVNLNNEENNWFFNSIQFKC